MKRATWLLFALISTTVVLVVSMACSRTEPAPVTLKREAPVKIALPTQDDHPLRIGMGAMITPKDGYVYYQRLQAYIGKKLGRTVQLVDRGNYDEMNRLLETGELDAAFVCAGPYVEGKKNLAWNFWSCRWSRENRFIIPISLFINRARYDILKIYGAWRLLLLIPSPTPESWFRPLCWPK